MFHQGVTESTSDDPTTDAPPNQPLHKKDDDPSKTATADSNTAPANPADNAPLPLKLSLNLFAPKSETGKAENPKSGDRKAEGKAHQTDASPLVSPLPGLIQQPAVSVTTQKGTAIDANDASASQGNPRVDMDQKPAGAPPASQLAFALRMTPTGEQTPAGGSGHVKGADSPAGGAVTSAQMVQAQERESASADSNSANHHSADQQGDAGIASDAVPPASTLMDGGSFQAVHATALDSTPAPAAPAPAQTPATPSQIAVHAPAALHADATAKTGTASELSFTVSGSDQQKVEVRVTDRAGEVRVSVRTPNEELASTLRSDLGSLTGKLNQSGYTAEAFAPASHSGEFSQRQGNASSDQQQQSGGQDRNFHRQGQQQDSPQGERGKRPQWLDELENSMANAPVRKETR